MVSHVIVPLDQSSLAESVLPFARGLATAWGVPITLLGVPEAPGGFLRGEGWEPRSSGVPDQEPNDEAGTRGYQNPLPSSPGGPSSSDVDELADRIVEFERYLQSIAAEISEVPVDTLVRPGVPAERICEVAHDVDAPVIVMASHGRSGLRRAVIGSIASSVIDSCDCPLFVIRGSTDSRNDRAYPAPRRILVPLDGSRLSEQAITTVRYLFGSEIDEIRLVRVPELASDVEVADYLEQVAGCLRDQGLNASWEYCTGNIAQEIYRVAYTRNADLIAMATRGQSGLADLVLGTVAERVLHESTLPLLLVRPREADLE